MLALRSPGVTVVPLGHDPRIPLVANLEASDLALLVFGSIARLVAKLHGVSEAARRAAERETEVAGGIQPIQVSRCLLDVAQPPEPFQPVAGQGRMDADRQLLFPYIGPFQVRIFDERNKIPAGEITIAVCLESETRGELLAVGVVVGEVNAAKP